MHHLERDRAMTAIELKAVREWLGLSGDWLAERLGVIPRTVRNWEQGKYPIPDGVRLEVEALEALTTQAVTMNVEALMDKPEPAIVTYRADEDYWSTLDDSSPRWPASWHRRVVMRIRQDVPGLAIIEGAPAG